MERDKWKNWRTLAAACGETSDQPVLPVKTSLEEKIMGKTGTE